MESKILTLILPQIENDISQVTKITISDIYIELSKHL